MNAATIERRKMPPPTQVPRTRTPLWRLIAWLLVVVGLWDGGGLAWGPGTYFSSAGYTAARELGIRPLGYCLVAIACGLIYCLGQSTRTQLLAVLVVGFGYNVLWLALLIYSWFSVGITGWTGPTKAASLAALYMILATRIDERRGT